MQTLRVCVRACRGPKPKSHVAIYHLSVKPISRSDGRSATAAAAYRAGEKGAKIIDLRTGEVHDFTRKRGVVSADLVLPANAPAWSSNRSELWNAAEKAETRKNSTVAREFEIALPSELSSEERSRLAHDFATELVERHGFVADVAIHLPSDDGDNRNHHAHILVSTRRLSAVGFTEKTRELDDLKTGPQLVREWRERWANLGGDALDRAGFEVEAGRHRAGHLPLSEQVEAARQRGDIEFVTEHQGRQPTKHLGPTATAYERRTGKSSRKRLDFEEVAYDRLAAAKLIGELEREEGEITRSIIDLSSDIRAATQIRNQTQIDSAQWAAQYANDRIKKLKNKQSTEGATSHGNGSKSGAGIWTFEYNQSPFKTYELDPLSNRSILETQTLDNLRDLSSIDVVPGRFGGQVLLPSDALDKLANREPNTVEELRRSVADKRSLSHSISDLQQYKRQLLMGADEQRPGDESAPLGGLSRDTLGSFFAEQLMTAHLRTQEHDEHERLKPPSP